MALDDFVLKPVPTPATADYSVEDAMMEQQRTGEEPPADDTPAAPKEDPVAKLMRWGDPTVSLNIATELNETQLGAIGQRVIEETDLDINSRSEWLKQGKAAMELALQKTKEKTYPWARACFSLDTDILTDRGWKPIGDAKVGDMVLSRAPDGTADYYPVTRTFRHTATHVVHFQGKSIDLKVTPNHKMLVHNRQGKKAEFIEAGEFARRKVNERYIPLTSTITGEKPDKIHGIDAKAYMRFLGWFISEGTSMKSTRPTVHKSGKVVYNVGFSSFSICQSRTANPKKFDMIRRDIEACGFTYKEYRKDFIIHATSMPQAVKDELRSLGRVTQKHIPPDYMKLHPSLQTDLLDTLILGDGCVRKTASGGMRAHYDTTSKLLADQVQEICQRIGMRGTVAISGVEGRLGGVINGRQIISANTGYRVAINEKTQIDCSYMKATLIQFGKDVACVEVAPHHTVYVRREGRALWCGNSNVIFPLMTQAADQFAARAYPGIIQNRNVVKGVVSGDDSGTPQIDPNTQQPVMDDKGAPVWEIPPGAKAARASRIGDHMSWQLIEEQTEWEAETDTMLNVLAIIGCEFRKTYYDPDLGRNMAVRVSAENLIINYWAKSMETAPRLTEVIRLYPYQIRERVASEFFCNHEYQSSAASNQDRDAPHEFYEQHRRIDLDGDGYPEPYIVTVHKETMKVARIVARYDIEDGIKTHVATGKIAKIVPVHYYTKYDFMPNKEGGIYGQGFGQLLTPINESINSTLNMLLDAGHLQNTGGGFIGKGLSMHSGTVSFRPGEYKVVNAVGSSIRDSVVPLVHQGPSATLLTLLGTLIEAGKDISSVKDVLAGELKAQTMSPTVFMALIEQGLKVFTSIYKRIHRSLKDEFEKLYRLNRLYLQEQTSYRVGDQWKKIERKDYEAGAGVDPISDPTMVVDAQRMARTQVLAEFKDDAECDGVEIRRRIFEAAGINDIDKVLVSKPATNPELILKMAELELKGMAAKVGVLVGLSTVFKNMADADAKVMEPFLQWQQTQLQGIKNEFDAINAKGQANQPGNPAGSAGVEPGAVPNVEAPPNNQGIPPLSGGFPGGASAGPPSPLAQ